MKTTYPCPMMGDDDAVQRYVAGTLPPEEAQAFEIHLLECDACVRAVEEGAAAAAALRPGGVSRRRAASLWGPPLAAAAVVALWLLLSREDALVRLSRVDPVPGFAGVPVRAEPDSATSLVDRGMAAYGAGDFTRAADLLARSADFEANPGVLFFLGIARLKTGASAEAARALRSALDPPGNRYAAEALLYRAKAWLALRNADSALAQLAAVPTSPGPVHAHARALADSIRSVMAR